MHLPVTCNAYARTALEMICEMKELWEQVLVTCLTFVVVPYWVKPINAKLELHFTHMFTSGRRSPVWTQRSVGLLLPARQIAEWYVLLAFETENVPQP